MPAKRLPKVGTLDDLALGAGLHGRSRSQRDIIGPRWAPTCPNGRMHTRRRNRLVILLGHGAFSTFAEPGLFGNSRPNRIKQPRTSRSRRFRWVRGSLNISQSSRVPISHRSPDVQSDIYASVLIARARAGASGSG